MAEFEPARDFTGGQFPSLDGDQPREVAQRQPADNDEGYYHRTFTVHNRAHTPNLPDDHPWHEQNAVEVIADAIRRGLHPKGGVELVGERPHPTDPNSTDVEYRVPVVPAIVDHDQTTTVTPSSEDAEAEEPDQTEEPEHPVAPVVPAAAVL